MNVSDVVEQMLAKGVRLWSEQGRLRYKAPRGALTVEELSMLKTSRDEIVAHLGGGGPAGQPRRHFQRAPLTFSQLAHWRLYRLDQRPAIRQIASVTRLTGSLSVSALRTSLAEIVRRHDALRTRIVVVDATPIQEVSDSGVCELCVEDLSELDENSHKVAVNSMLEKVTMEPVRLDRDPLFAVRLLKLGAAEHLLIVAMEHMISDMFSLNILFRELATAYAQVVQGQPVLLPEVALQFSDFAVWQRSTHSAWEDRHGDYWKELTMRSPRLRFPEDSSVIPSTGWETVTLRITRQLREELSEWCRLRRTTLVMSVFTAYVALVLRWCSASDSVVRFDSDGRTSPKLEATIGFFASALYVRTQLHPADNFLDLLDRMTAEFCRAHEHADASFVATLEPRPAFTHNTFFNWVPHGSEVGLVNLGTKEEPIACAPVPFDHPMLRNLELDSEPGILFHDVGTEVIGSLHFPLSRFSGAVMRTFAHNLTSFIETLLREPDRRIAEIPLVR